MNADQRTSAAIATAHLAERGRIDAWDEQLWLPDALVGPLAVRLQKAVEAAFDRWCEQQAESVRSTARVLRADGMPIEDIPDAAIRLEE